LGGGKARGGESSQDGGESDGKSHGGCLRD